MIPESTNAFQILPAEILDHIFGFLHNDPATLRSIDELCSEAHNTFLRGILDRHLYAHIVVTNFISTKPGLFHYFELFQYLSSKPYVSKYIRTLQIEIEMPGPSSQWYDPLSSILRMLPSTLEGITLSSRTPSTSLRWLDLHKAFREAFLDFLRSSNLTDASIHCVNGVPLSAFNDCSMQKLSLRRVGVYSSSVVEFPPKTTSLMIDRCADLSGDGLLIISDWAQGGPNLRSLNFSSDSHYPFFHFLKGLCAESLTDLRLDFGTMFGFPYPPPQIKLKMFHPQYLNISRLPNLTELTIWASISKESWIESPIPSIAQVAATSPSLKRLILRIKIDPRYAADIAKSKIWQPLASLTVHPSLEHIELGVILESSKRRRIPDIDVISTLLRVSEVKKMYEESFLSVKEIGE